MTVTVKSPGMAKQPWMLWEPRISTGLLGFYLLGNGADYGPKNHAGGGPDLEPIGAPVFRDGYVSCVGGSAFLDTLIADRADGSFAIVARRTSANTGSADSPIYVGNYSAGTNLGGASLYATASGSSKTTRGGALYTDSGGTVETTTVAAADAKWRLLIFRWKSGTGHKIFDLTDGVSDGKSKTTARLLSPFSFRIGGGVDTFLGSCDVCFSAIYGRSLEDAEVASTGGIVLDARQYASEFGITV
ncbi:hypothetical protein [Hansschlegelia plantiphila]|uniref:Uncharacterized protein n=1 Tax=Hansschlegelia plantiphila TaxID=374655 RepID=A0A9W6J065_9HYPH|nr:hypothetical protein [Hansschlegelia plantiphila]GLK66998.1 hypothetical protein GCM10008179_06360 [Hansschlegelia plantiphila]